ncbi:ribosome maturation factor RimP [Eggerthella sp. BIOML-A1]|uniref:ribosome maturation factor RimP n=1 Tax=unclassified Eggerthella TaxID=2648737 RepID=UPI001369AE18|nr:ribosome maturation factor RimP [Eggerthella sp. BIOML-A3]MZJ99547.1 ribosome maturation factor RimP [Eggerthella sp. BIOML-A1]MZK37215.1 ribosome maturation factor RimP [Eggerthella sp. BIOML-A5]
MLGKKEQQLLDALAPRAEQEGVEVVTVEVAGAKKAPTIRVYIDTPDGVSFDELSSAQAWINDIMDELDPFPGAYTLEVSSPGIDRPLRTAEHFARFAGETAVLKTQPVDGRSNWTGTIVGADADAVTLAVDGAEARIPMDVVKRAHLKGTIDFSSQASI